jgi:hypothetical protein
MKTAIAVPKNQPRDREGLCLAIMYEPFGEIKAAIIEGKI